MHWRCCFAFRELQCPIPCPTCNSTSFYVTGRITEKDHFYGLPGTAPRADSDGLVAVNVRFILRGHRRQLGPTLTLNIHSRDTVASLKDMLLLNVQWLVVKCQNAPEGYLSWRKVLDHINKHDVADMQLTAQDLFERTAVIMVNTLPLSVYGVGDSTAIDSNNLCCRP
jgi:hypothetical protein